MSRHRDYQPTIDRARSQAEVAQRRESKLREKKDECHREMLRAQAAARIANEEVDALREQNERLSQANRDLRAANYAATRSAATRAEIIVELQQQLEHAKHPLLASWRRVRDWMRDLLRQGAEA